MQLNGSMGVNRCDLARGVSFDNFLFNLWHSFRSRVCARNEATQVARCLHSMQPQGETEKWKGDRLEIPDAFLGVRARTTTG